MYQNPLSSLLKISFFANRPLIKGYIFICFFLSACALTRPEKKDTKPLAEPTPEEEKIKLGLFISGAGANTFSALPLLELFQKQNIPFDFTAGTGWGAWLAGLYAKNQTVDDIKWNLFKLKEQGVFEKKWFRKKRKNARLLKNLTKEALFSPLSVPFVCPVVNNRGQVFWIQEKRSGKNILQCLNNTLPHFFSFGSTKEQGSFFSAELTLKYLQKKGINTLLWVKPNILLKNEPDKHSILFWRELSAYLNNLQKRYTFTKTIQTKGKPWNNIIILETKTSSFSVSDFSQLHTIMKSPVPLREKQKIINLKLKLKSRLKKLSFPQNKNTIKQKTRNKTFPKIQNT